MSTLEFNVVPVTPFEQNCCILRCPKTGRGALVDPGGDAERILDAARKQGVEIEKVLLTHGHFDHVGSATEIARRLDVPIEGPHREDAFLLNTVDKWCSQFGFPAALNVVPDRWLEDGDEVTVGEQRLQVLHCPGHTPGHIVFFDPAGRLAWVGDVLFNGSIGRTDFPRSDHDALLHSISERLLPLGDDVRFVPGHGPMSTFGEERQHNPFISSTRWG